MQILLTCVFHFKLFVPFGFEGGILELIALVPDQYLLIYFYITAGTMFIIFDMNKAALRVNENLTISLSLK